MKTQQLSKAEQLFQAADQELQKSGPKAGDITEVTDLGDNTAVAKLKADTSEEAMAAYLRYKNDFVNLSGRPLTSRQAMRVLRAYVNMPFEEPKIKDPLEALMLNALIMLGDAKYKFITMVQEEKRQKLATMSASEKIEMFNDVKKEVESE